MFKTKVHKLFFASMALITFMSDFGEEDHYVAAVKASILRINPGIQITLEDQRNNRLLPIEMSVLSIGYRQNGRLSRARRGPGLEPAPRGRGRAG